MRGIIILEGGDCTGKSTLALAVIRQHGGQYVHNGIFDDMLAAHTACVDAAIAAAQEQLVVIDRLWISEQVYGQVFRGGPAYDAEDLDRRLRHAGAVTVLCVREDQRRHLEHFKAMKNERPEQFEDIAQVIRLYADVAHGDLTKAGDTYLDKLIRHGEFRWRSDIMLYDMDRETTERGVRLAAACLRNFQKIREAMT